MYGMDTVNEDGHSLRQTPDGGFIIAGYAGSPFQDVYVVKTDAQGDTMWTRCHGGTEDDYGEGICLAHDSGYLVVGFTRSYGVGSSDIYLIKIDSNGERIWHRTYGGTSVDFGHCIQQTSDGGYILVGGYGVGGGNLGTYLVKLEAQGDTIWTRLSNINPMDWARYVCQTFDGGYIVTGATLVSPVNFNYDLFLSKYNSDGIVEWTRMYGGPYEDWCYCVKQTPDSGYILVGYIDRINFVGGDAYVIKTNSLGDTLWTRRFGETGLCDIFISVDVTSDGGYLCAGYATSFEPRGEKLYMVKMNSEGERLWAEYYGDYRPSSALSVVTTQDGGAAIAGYVTPPYIGYKDVWLLRLPGTPPSLSLTLTPVNPPILIPAGGGNFFFTAEVQNSTAAAVTFDAWTEVILPGGAAHGPLIMRANLPIAPSQTIVRTGITQFVPSYAPEGDYTYNGYVGSYPDSVIDEDSFEFTKLPGEAPPTHNQGWSVYGWDDDEDGFRIQDSGFRVLSVNPNPFNASTVARFELRDASQVELALYDIAGREVAVLAEGFYPAGAHQAVWDASAMASGVYFARLQAGSEVKTKKLLLIK